MSVSKIEKASAPKLYIDGKRVTPMLYGLSDIPASATNTAYAFKNISAFADAGVNLVAIDTELRLGWHKSREFETDAILAEIANVLDANPSAKVLIRLHMNAPYWWVRDNPDEQVIYAAPDGDVAGIDDGEYDRLIGGDGSNHMRVSIASEKWLNEAGEKFKRLCDDLKESGIGDAVFAIQVACGKFGEWHAWGTYPDVSARAKEYYRKFLKNKYHTNENLQKAWNDANVTIDTAGYFPDKHIPGDEGVFRDPEKSMCNIDSRESAQGMVLDAILYFCRILKECMPTVLAGTFYGYYFGTGGDHLKVDGIYAAKGTVDFLAAPFCYGKNRSVDGIPAQRGLLETNRLRGMLWLTEMDQHPEDSKLEGGGNPEKFPETIAIIRRNVLQSVFAGHGLWYYDHRVIPSAAWNNVKKSNVGSIYRKRGWWEEKELMREIEALKKLADNFCKKEYKPLADVLMVFSKRSFYYTSEYSDMFYEYIEPVGRCGAVYDCIYEDELEIADIERYKCVIFANHFYMTPAEREKYKKLLKNTNVIWLGPQGYCDGHSLSDRNVSDTVGITVKKIDTCEALTISGCSLLASTDMQLTQNQPAFEVDDAQALPIAHYNSGKVAAAVKDNSVWLPSTTTNYGVMKAIFSRFGVHIWCDSKEPVLAGGNMVALTSAKGGLRRINLPNGKSVEYDFPPFSTLVFDTESGERIL